VLNLQSALDARLQSGWLKCRAPPWLARPHATLLTLGRLGRVECTQLVAGVAASRDLSAETVAAIVAKTDGVPLFVEELTKSMMESDLPTFRPISGTSREGYRPRCIAGGYRPVAAF
jgi:predicted ATPase